MSALDQLERGLTLADPALAGYQHSLAVYLDQHAVHGGPRCEMAAQGLYRYGHELGRITLGFEQVHVAAPGRIYALLIYLGPVTEHHGGRLAFHQLFKAHAPVIRAQSLQIRALDTAEDLHALRIKIVVKSGELQPRAVDVGGIDEGLIVIRSGVHHFELELLHHIRELHRVLIHSTTSLY